MTSSWVGPPITAPDKSWRVLFFNSTIVARHLTPIVVLHLSSTVVSSTYINVLTPVQAGDKFFITSLHRLRRVKRWPLVEYLGTGRMKPERGSSNFKSCALFQACSKQVVCFVLSFLCPLVQCVIVHILRTCPGVSACLWSQFSCVRLFVTP